MQNKVHLPNVPKVVAQTQIVPNAPKARPLAPAAHAQSLSSNAHRRVAEMATAPTVMVVAALASTVFAASPKTKTVLLPAKRTRNAPSATQVAPTVSKANVALLPEPAPKPAKQKVTA